MRRPEGAAPLSRPSVLTARRRGTMMPIPQRNNVYVQFNASVVTPKTTDLLSVLFQLVSTPVCLAAPTPSTSFPSFSHLFRSRFDDSGIRSVGPVRYANFNYALKRDTLEHDEGSNHRIKRFLLDYNFTSLKMEFFMEKTSIRWGPGLLNFDSAQGAAGLVLGLN